MKPKRTNLQRGVRVIRYRETETERARRVTSECEAILPPRYGRILERLPSNGSPRMVAKALRVACQGS